MENHVKERISDSFQLLDNEEVLLQKTIIGAPKYCGYLLFLIIIGIYLFSIISIAIWINLLFEVFLIFFIFFTCCIGFVGLFLAAGYFTDINYSLLITNIRIMKIPYKRFLPQIYKIKEILLKNVDYITFDWRVIIIVEKSFSGQPYYKDTEKEYKNRPKDINSILYHLRENQEPDLRKKILEILIHLTKARKHPNISDLYISTI